MEEEDKTHKINPEIFKDIKEITPEMDALIDEFISDVAETTDKILKAMENIDPKKSE
jgi:hypothetical protein